MAVVCGACSAENRDGAKFCKACGARLAPVKATAVAAAGEPSEWPATAPAPMRPSVDVPPPGDATVILGAARRSAPIAPSAAPAAQPVASAPAPTPAPRSSRTPRPSPAAAPARAVQPPPRPPATAPLALPPRHSIPVPLSPRRRAARSKSIKIGAGLLLALVLAAGIAWQWLDDSGRNERAPVTAPSQPAPAPTPPTAAAAPPAEAAPPAPAAPVPEVAAVAPAPPAAVAPAAPRAAAPAKPPRKPAAPVPAPARPEPAPAVAAAQPAPAPEPAPPPEPRSQCAGRNFISTAGCMAAQCQKAEYRAHPQCEAVRRQQQLEEEKRNPSQLN